MPYEKYINVALWLIVTLPIYALIVYTLTKKLYSKRSIEAAVQSRAEKRADLDAAARRAD